VDALITCANQPAAAGQTYLVSDGDDISTPDLCASWERNGSSGTFVFLPPPLLKSVARLIGKTDQINVW